ncbi:hypothetical protein HNP48_002248 [Acidovorax soli]|uniref:Uncharacterized protein n=1 Tax=Acidovorax soli TaxID=592050 RepID=A0A7X0PDJ2_9BURK|nr:hypothetical protein [Acidovorax soli]MBB6559581.1 hypothetical protein [Acidovorax soli]
MGYYAAPLNFEGDAELEGGYTPPSGVSAVGISATLRSIGRFAYRPPLNTDADATLKGGYLRPSGTAAAAIITVLRRPLADAGLQTVAPLGLSGFSGGTAQLRHQYRLVEPSGIDASSVGLPSLKLTRRFVAVVHSGAPGPVSGGYTAPPPQYASATLTQRGSFQRLGRASVANFFKTIAPHGIPQPGASQPMVIEGMRWIHPLGWNGSVVPAPFVKDTAIKPVGIPSPEAAAGRPTVFNWRQYVLVLGAQASLHGTAYVQGGVKFVAPQGLQSFVLGAVTVINTRADQSAKPPGIAAPGMGAVNVSPRILRLFGIYGTAPGFPRVQFPPQPKGWLSTAFGYATVEFKTKQIRPVGFDSSGAAFPRVADRARKVFHVASVVTSVFGDVQVRAKNFRVTVPGLLSQEMSPWAEVRNTRRFLSVPGMPAPGVGAGTTARNKTPSIAPGAISSLQFGRVDHLVVAWRVREVAPSGIPVPLSPLGKPVLWQTPSFTPLGIAAPAVPGPMVSHGRRALSQTGSETLRAGMPTVGFAYRAIVAEDRGIDGAAWGRARVEHEHRTIDLLSQGFMAFGTAWVERGRRAIAPASIREPDMHQHQIAGTRYLGAEGFEATRWLTRIIPVSREIFPKTFGASYGLAAVQHRKRFLLPLGVTTYPEPVQHWGTARAWNLRQVVTMYEDQSSGLWPLPWPQWTAIENRNRTPRVTGFNAGRVPQPTIANKARTLAPGGMAFPVLPEYQKTGMVSHRLRPLPLEGIEAPPMTRWAIVHNKARPVQPAGFAATVPGQAQVVNLRRFYRVQGFDSAWFGYPFVAPRIRELTFESRYGIQPPRIELPVVQLYARHIEPKSIDQSGMGAVELRVFFRKITPRWTVRDVFGEAVLRNKTPEVRTRGRAADEWGDALVRLQWRPVKPEGTSMELFGQTKIADRKQRLTVPGANYMLVSDKVTVRRIGAIPVVTQYIDLRWFVIAPDGSSVESDSGYGIPYPWPAMGQPDLLKGYIFHGQGGGPPNDMLAMGRPTITANGIRVEPGIFDFYVGEPFVSLKRRAVAAPSLGQLVVDGTGTNYMGSWGKPALSPHTIYAVMEATAQAMRNHNMNPTSLHPVRAFEEFGRPSVFTWRGVVAPHGIASSGAGGTVGTTWGVGQPSLHNRRQEIRAIGSLMQRLGWPTIPGPQTVLIEDAITGYAAGTPTVGRPPYVGPSYIRAGAVSFQEFGLAMVDHRHRTVRPAGWFTQIMGSSYTPDGNGTLYMPQALHVGPKRPTIPNGYDAALYGTPWVSLRVRELQAQGHDSFVSEYDLQNFAKRMRVRNVDTAWGGRRSVFTQGHASSQVGAPGVRPGTHYIRPDGNADQYRKGAF